MTAARPVPSRRRRAATAWMLAAAAPLALSLTACGSDRSASAGPTGAGARATASREARPSPDGSSPTELEFHLVDYGFEGPTEVRAGPVRLSVVNDGNQFHHLTLARLRDGVSFDHLDHLAHQGDGDAVEEAITDVGGVNVLSPGERGVAELTIDEPGDYVLLCFVPGADGRSHLAHGMLRPLTVTAPTGVTDPPPRRAAAVTVRMKDFAYVVDHATLPAGRRTLSFTNAGSQPHEAIVVRLDPGRTGADLLTYFSKLADGSLAPGEEAPGTALGGPAAVAPGRSIAVELDLEPGTYALFCAIPDPHHDGLPHVAQGMYAEITVR